MVEMGVVMWAGEWLSGPHQVSYTPGLGNVYPGGKGLGQGKERTQSLPASQPQGTSTGQSSLLGPKWFNSSNTKAITTGLPVPMLGLGTTKGRLLSGKVQNLGSCPVQKVSTAAKGSWAGQETKFKCRQGSLPCSLGKWAWWPAGTRGLGAGGR